MSSSLRRLASEHASLQRSDLPPNYLFPPSQTAGALPDDLRQLTILVTGPQGTPYAQGLWQLHLRMPADYPTSPPRATFQTRMWHPNVEETTGAVCLETLKRDWDAKLTLRDILVAISCLLIHPNPDSALNSAAASVLQDDYEAFAAQAGLMTSIHARVPVNLRQTVDAARRRGEDRSTALAEREASRTRSGKNARPCPFLLPSARNSAHGDKQQLPPDEEEEEHHDATKENDPTQAPSPVIPSPRSPRKKVLGKRPLSELPTPTGPDEESESDIAIQNASRNTNPRSSGLARKWRKLAVTRAGTVPSGRSRGEPCGNFSHREPSTSSVQVGERQNGGQEGNRIRSDVITIPIVLPVRTLGKGNARPTSRNMLRVSTSKDKAQPRIGIRRL